MTTRTRIFVTPEALQLLALWLSPAFPTGAFAYSHGLEQAVAAGEVRDRPSLADWVADALTLGGGRNDAILLAAAWRAPDDAEVDALARALAPSRERLLETERQGAAFAAAVSAAWTSLAPAPYPVALGRAARAEAIPLAPTLTLHLQAFAANLVSAGVRLIPLGQAEAQRAVAALMPLCRQTAAEAEQATLDDLGGCALRWDVAAMRHENQDVRLFQT